VEKEKKELKEEQKVQIYETLIKQKIYSDRGFRWGG